MNWRRAATRYGQTPAPATPYQRAEQLWDERIGSARVQAANWRLMAFGALALAAVAMGDDIRARSRSSVTPYVVEVDRTGAANAIAPAVTEYQPSDAQIGYFLARFVQNTRALSVDPIVVRQAWLDAYDQITSHAKPVLDDYARQVDPFGKVGHRAVTADVTSVVRASDKSFRIAWIEHAYEEGAAIPAERWSAILTVITQTPRTEERLRKNPLGIYIRRNCLVTGAGRQWMRHTIALGVAAVLPLAACAPEIPQISYDDPAALHTEPPKPVKIVQMPELLPLPGQLKRMPRGAGSTSASEPRDPARRVQLANAAASVKPTRAGYVNAIQVYPYSDGALYQLYVAPVHVTDITLEPGEELKAVAAGDTTQWKIGDTESGSGATRQAHVLVKPVSADLPMNNIVIATDRRTYHIEAHPTRETYMAAVSWRYPQDEFVALRRQNAEAEARVNVAAAGGIDVTSLRFRYRISGDSPPWRPVQAFDDGHKVYIQFPLGIAQGETPPLFIIGPTGEAELVNYRVKGSTYIVDRLFAAAELRLGSNPQQTVRISRTDGR